MLRVIDIRYNIGDENGSWSVARVQPIKRVCGRFLRAFEFYCLANNIRGKGDVAANQKKLFLTLVGQAAFAKLKTRASPRLVSELMLDQIMEHLQTANN